jgi:RNA polymerase sigma-70 factor (ECF subfamily)
VERWERQQLIKNALDALPPEKRTVFRMVYRENMDRSLVAETLGIPEGTVKSRLHYVMKNLMERWKDFDQDDA